MSAPILHDPASILADIDRAAAAIRKQTAHPIDIILVLGSGLGALADAVEADASIPYAEIPGFPLSGVSGHAGRLIVGRLEGANVAVMSGRAHMYEGHDLVEVVRPVRTLARLGARAAILTNAAGGLNPLFVPGDLMIIADHLNLTGRSPLSGVNVDELGPRFPDMTHCWNPKLREALHAAARGIDLTVREGVYAWNPGPQYETPAEIRMLARLGADAVGMSTVPEAIALNHMGVKVAGVSCVTNLAAGISPTALSHDEVKETALRVALDFQRLIAAAVARTAALIGEAG